jgi:murein DD-endopeptidase MepM/ murein hydrolase activator NlpD
MLKTKSKIVFLITICAALAACSKSGGPLAVFKKLSPHDAYAQRLKDVGLDQSAMGSAWLLNASQVMGKTLNIAIPYKETGYFAGDKVSSTALRFSAKRGQKLRVNINKKPAANFNIYADLFEENGTQPKLIAFADTTGAVLEHDVKQTASYILRLQPELLRSGEYTLTITAGPSLGFPVSESGKPHIGSFWGDGRDEGGRKHEGIDVFAPKRTPAIAAANGTVTGVTVNKLGGNVVFMRPANADYTLYYAHLDQQLVQPGQNVLIGDTIGLVGNTGNARTTPPHLHFGIYTSSGAIDPLVFVDRATKSPLPVTAPLKNLNATVRTTNRTRLYNQPFADATVLQNLDLHTALSVSAATDGWYKVTLPDGQNGFVNSKNISSTADAIRSITIKTDQPLFNAPDSIRAPRKKVIKTGEKVNLLAKYQSYLLVDDDGVTGWIEDRKSR